jgi:hypothetical protein
LTDFGTKLVEILLLLIDDVSIAIGLLCKAEEVKNHSERENVGLKSKVSKRSSCIFPP